MHLREKYIPLRLKEERQKAEDEKLRKALEEVEKQKAKHKAYLDAIWQILTQ